MAPGAFRKGGSDVKLKNEATVAGRVLRVRFSVHPDFLWSFLALTKFMRPSLMKAARPSVAGASCRKSGTMGRKRILQMVSLHCPRILVLGRNLLPCSRSVGWAAPVFFSPCTVRRTWDTRPEPYAVVTRS